MDALSAIDRLKREWNGRADSAILDELRRLGGLPDERDPSWDDDETWSQACLLVALADHVAARRLHEGVPLVLENMCLGDPGEVMSGMCHALEAAVSPDWSLLASICVACCSSERAGTRYWAVDELGALRDAAAIPTVLSMFDDREPEVAVAAFRAAAMMVQAHPEHRAEVIKLLRAVANRRAPLRDDALECVREIQCAAPAVGTIDHAQVEAVLARAVRAQLDGAGRTAELSSAFEWLLGRCLENCDEWDGAGVPDGLFECSIASSAPNTLDVRGQMFSFKDRGHCVEPFEATVALADGDDSITRATIKYGDAEMGLGAIGYGEGRKDPEHVTAWLYVFEKS